MVMGEVLIAGAVGIIIALIVEKIESAALPYVMFSLKFRGFFKKNVSLTFVVYFYIEISWIGLFCTFLK